MLLIGSQYRLGSHALQQNDRRLPSRVKSVP
jgi:hypothetical protein